MPTAAAMALRAACSGIANKRQHTLTPPEHKETLSPAEALGGPRLSTDAPSLDFPHSRCPQERQDRLRVQVVRQQVPYRYIAYSQVLLENP